MSNRLKPIDRRTFLKLVVPSGVAMLVSGCTAINNLVGGNPTATPIPLAAPRPTAAPATPTSDRALAAAQQQAAEAKATAEAAQKERDAANAKAANFQKQLEEAKKTPTPAPAAETPTPVPADAIKYTTFANADEVVKVRGGNPDNWVLKVEVRDGKDGMGKIDPNETRYGHTIDGGTPQITLVKNEWMYRGSMSDLKPEFQIPQTVEAIAKQLGGNVKPENIRVIRITHDASKPSYARWMDLWQVKEGTIIGYEIMQNHQTINGSTNGKGLEPYTFNLPPGAVVECYDDRQTEEPRDDVAASIFNPTDKPMKLFISGGTVWPWGDVNALIVEQGNFENGSPGATSTAIISGKAIKLNVASNVLSPQTAHAIAKVDSSTGKIVLTGLINNPGKAPVKDEAAH